MTAPLPDPDWTIHPGELWAEAITEAGRTQRDVARQVGCSDKHLSRIINGRALPSAVLTVAFARALDLPVELMWNLCAKYQLDLALGKRDLTNNPLPGDSPQAEGAT